MKNKYFIGICIGIICLLGFSCSEDEVATYSGPEAVNILINGKDSAEMSFLSLDPDVSEYIFNVEVSLQTELANRDRTVKFGLGPNTTAKDNENFVMVNSLTIAKGEVSAILPIKVFKAGLSDIEGGIVAEILILPSDDFVPGVYPKMKLTFAGDYPKTWQTTKGNDFWLGYNLGRCTKAKYEFVYTILGTIDLTPYWDMYPSMNLATRLNQELDNWALNNGGKRLPDDDGSDMKFSTNS